MEDVLEEDSCKGFSCHVALQGAKILRLLSLSKKSHMPLPRSFGQTGDKVMANLFQRAKVAHRFLGGILEQVTQVLI